MKIVRRIRIETQPPRAAAPTLKARPYVPGPEGRPADLVDEPRRPLEDFVVNGEAVKKQMALDRIAKRWDKECGQITLNEDGSTDTDGRWQIVRDLGVEMVEIVNGGLR